MHNSNTGIFWKMKDCESLYKSRYSNQLNGITGDKWQCQTTIAITDRPSETKTEPMETIKNKEPEQTQESPSKEIINALVFVGVAVLSVYIYLNQYPFNKALNISNIPLVALIVCLLIMAYLLGLVDTWLKQNIDPYLLKIKSWLNRRNEQ